MLCQIVIEPKFQNLTLKCRFLARSRALEIMTVTLKSPKTYFLTLFLNLRRGNLFFLKIKIKGNSNKYFFFFQVKSHLPWLGAIHDMFEAKLNFFLVSVFKVKGR